MNLLGLQIGGGYDRNSSTNNFQKSGQVLEQGQSSSVTNGVTKGSSVTDLNKTTVKQKQLSPEAFQKILYDIVSSANGLSSLASGENAVGGYGSATKALMAQDYAIKVAGELANVVAADVTTETGQQVTSSESSTSSVTNTNSSTWKDVFEQGNSKTVDKKASGKTVICTELNRQGKLPDSLYYHPAALEHFQNLPADTISGYHAWGNAVARACAKSERLSKLLLPVAVARYRMITTGEFNLIGATTIYIGQPLCNLLGKLISKKASYAFGS